MTFFLGGGHESRGCRDRFFALHLSKLNDPVQNEFLLVWVQGWHPLLMRRGGNFRRLLSNQPVEGKSNPNPSLPNLPRLSLKPIYKWKRINKASTDDCQACLFVLLVCLVFLNCPAPDGSVRAPASARHGTQIDSVRVSRKLEELAPFWRETMGPLVKNHPTSWRRPLWDEFPFGRFPVAKCLPLFFFALSFLGVWPKVQMAGSFC